MQFIKWNRKIETILGLCSIAILLVFTQYFGGIDWAMTTTFWMIPYEDFYDSYYFSRL